MKQLLFLLLFPCLAMAQYPGNAGQKITLGEQTSADGLVYRGLASDTTRKPSVDTMAFILLDTNTNIIWQYKKAVNNAWTRVGGSISSGVTGVLPVANGGTNASTLAANKVMVGNGTSGVLTPTNLHWDNTNERVGIGTSSPDSKLHIVQSTSTANASGIRLTNTTTSPTGFNNFSYNITQNIEPSSSSTGDYGAMNLLTSYNNSNVNSGRFNYAINSTATNASTGTITNMYGSVSSAGSSNASGIVTNSESTRSSIYNLNGTITNAYGFRFGGRIFTGATQATITNAYGLYINNVDFATTLNYSLYSVGGTNYFGGNVGIGQTTPTAVLHLKAGTATAGTAPLKFTSGVNLTSPLGGEMEFNGTNLFFSPSTTRHTVNHGLTGSATLNFPSTTTLLSADLTITVTGAADGDVVSLGVPNAAVNANTSYSAWVSAANTVTVRFNNYSSGTVDPASGLFKVFVTK